LRRCNAASGTEVKKTEKSPRQNKKALL